MDEIPRLVQELGKAIDPQYDGWVDQYKAVLVALDINMDMSLAQVRQNIPTEITAKWVMPSGEKDPYEFIWTK